VPGLGGEDVVGAREAGEVLVAAAVPGDAVAAPADEAHGALAGRRRILIGNREPVAPEDLEVGLVHGTVRREHGGGAPGDCGRLVADRRGEVLVQVRRDAC
jgi:hypothetical protein